MRLSPDVEVIIDTNLRDRFLVPEQRHMVERLKRLTRAAKMDRERQGQNVKIPSSIEPLNPNRMFAIDTSNKELPTFEVEETNDSKPPYNKN